MDQQAELLKAKTKIAELEGELEKGVLSSKSPVSDMTSSDLVKAPAAEVMDTGDVKNTDEPDQSALASIPTTSWSKMCAEVG